MPLRDHFHPPIDRAAAWESLHASWPVMTMLSLKAVLPPGFIATVQIRTGPYVEGDADPVETVPPPPVPVPVPGVFDFNVPVADAFETGVNDVRGYRRQVATIFVVSPGNKHSREQRRAFVGKCATLLHEGVAVTLVDVVTSRPANLFGELLAFIGEPALVAPPPNYVATLRPEVGPCKRIHVRAEVVPLVIGRPLPAVTVWLPDELSVTLDLEASYEAACDGASIP